MNAKVKRVVSFLIVLCLSIWFVGCSMDSAKETVQNTAGRAKDTVINWYTNIDFSKFKEGWEYSVDYLGAKYSAVMTSEYVANIEDAITVLKSDMNNAIYSSRGTAQEAGYLAEKWVSDTFNINAAVNESEYSAKVVGSNKFGSVDVATNYGENASLKYYQKPNESASAQAKTLLEAYHDYCSSTKKDNPPTLAEYMNERGYDSSKQDALMASKYEGQTRIIPVDQIPKATEFLNGKIENLSDIEGQVAEGRMQSYIETLTRLKDRLSAPDGTESLPLSYEEAQAIAELSKEGNFKPEDFGISLATVISPKYVVKQAIGTGIEVGMINAVLSSGPDIYSILREAAESGKIDENKLKEEGIESVIAGAEGFVEGSISRIITTMCQTGAFGVALKEVNPSIVATLTVLLIEAAIHGYELSQGTIWAEDYGNMMVDRIMIMLLALPVSAMFLAVLPATHITMMAGCMAGGMMAALGYMATKEAVLDIVDGGGFEAIVPIDSVEAASVARDKVASLNIDEQVSTISDSVVSTVNDGYIKISSMIIRD